MKLIKTKKEIDVNTYVAEDGTFFEREKDCIYYENTKLIQQCFIKNVSVNYINESSIKVKVFSKFKFNEEFINKIKESDFYFINFLHYINLIDSMIEDRYILGKTFIENIKTDEFVYVCTSYNRDIYSGCIIENCTQNEFDKYLFLTNEEIHKNISNLYKLIMENDKHK